jgi:ubiquinone/menaquinone biosynthesis C-methylase UbiE
MKKLLLFEEFKENTLLKNISVYNDFLNKYKESDRSSIVAWEATDSQLKNFKLVSKYINNGDSILDYGCGIGDFISHLNTENIQISNYLGVDINKKYISIAKKSYKDYKFKLINNINDVNGNFDIVCAIGVFTWYIDKDDFIETINKLYDICNKEVLITCIHHNHYEYESEYYWESEYRKYNDQLFYDLFPNLNFKFDYSDGTMLVRIIK